MHSSILAPALLQILGLDDRAPFENVLKRTSTIALDNSDRCPSRAARMNLSSFPVINERKAAAYRDSSSVSIKNRISAAMS
jgi:hypothetical protein